MLQARFTLIFLATLAQSMSVMKPYLRPVSLDENSLEKYMENRESEETVLNRQARVARRSIITPEIDVFKYFARTCNYDRPTLVRIYRKCEQKYGFYRRERVNACVRANTKCRR